MSDLGRGSESGRGGTRSGSRELPEPNYQSLNSHFINTVALEKKKISCDVRHRRASETQRRTVFFLFFLQYYLFFNAPERRRRGHRGSPARCPSLLLAPGSALLPVNLAALWSGSDRRSQLAAVVPGLRRRGGDRMETVTSARALVCFSHAHEHELLLDAAIVEPTVE